VLGRLERGEIRVLGAETTAPSPFAHEILAAWGYAFLDDAPLEERCARAVQTHRSLLSSVLATGGLATLLDRALAVGPARWEKVARDEQGVLGLLDEAGFATADEVASFGDAAWVAYLSAAGEIVRRGSLFVASSFVATFDGAHADDEGAREELLRR